jgi:hypothetical protein
LEIWQVFTHFRRMVNDTIQDRESQPLPELLEISAALHHHLCPRQVLGVRMGMLAGDNLGLDLPQADKRLLTMLNDTAGDGTTLPTAVWTVIAITVKWATCRHPNQQSVHRPPERRQQAADY